MNRPFVYRGKPVAGVFQRCRADCPSDECSTHSWTYTIELPAGPNGKRRQIAKGGFATGRKAMEARADLAKQHRDGNLPDDMGMTVARYLPEYIEGKIQRGEIEGDTTARSYRDLGRYLTEKIGHRKLSELRGRDLTRAYAQIVSERQALRAAAEETNKRYAAEAEAENAKRKAAGKKRMVATKRVAVPRPISPATVARIHAVASGMLKSATKAGLISRNVAGDAELPKVEKKKVKPATPEQYGAFLDALEDDYRVLLDLAEDAGTGTQEARRRAAAGRMYPLVVVAGHSGLRRGELAGLKWADLDLETGRVVVVRQRVSAGYRVAERTPKTEAGEDRVVYLDAGTVAVLKSWRKVQLAERLAWGADYRDGGYVFTKENGEPYHPEYVGKAFSRLARQAGMSVTKLHGMRHFRAGALISTGADISAVSKAMGHASISVTSDVYGSLFEKAGKEMADRAAALVPRRRSA